MSASFSRSQFTGKPGVSASSNGVVAAQHVLAAQAGADVLAAGGDAVDAAVTVSFCLGVLEPWMSGPLGGGAMMLWRESEGCAHALTYGMRSSASLDPARYPLSGRGKASDLFPWEAVVEDRNVTGGSSVAVPGTVAGLDAAHGRFGRMPWRDLLDPAITHARQGLHVDWYAALVIASAARDLARDPEAAALFLDDGQWPKGAGWTALSDIRLDQSGHAATLAQLAHAGALDLYRGDLARTLVRDVRAKGGFLTETDLSGYAPLWNAPLVIPYRTGTVFAVPGLTAGPTLAQAMGEWQSGYASEAALTPDAHLARVEALKGAYNRRLTSMGDHESARSPGCTTHFSIVDAQGNMVAMTQTLLSIFGARCVAPGLGMLLNNGIMWFDPEQGRPNSLGPDKACLMNVCPVIGQSGTRRFALGASGGRKIMPAVGQIAASLIEQGLSMQDAIEAPRVDVSGGAQVIADERLAGPVTERIAKDHPLALAKRLPFPFAFACPAGVMRDTAARSGASAGAKTTGPLHSGTTETFSPWGDGVTY